MLPGLLQIGTLGWALQCDLPLLAAALGANAAVDCQAEAFFLAQIADGAGQAGEPRWDETVLLWHPAESDRVKTRMDVAFSSAPVEKTA